jgi:hypothetical protein
LESPSINQFPKQQSIQIMSHICQPQPQSQLPYQLAYNNVLIIYQKIDEIFKQIKQQKVQHIHQANTTTKSGIGFK